MPFVIAEAGSCHEGSFTRAQHLIERAKTADADAVKFQMWTSAKRMRERRHMTDPMAYETGSIYQVWLPLLADAAHAAGLEFMCTAYLPEDIAVVAPYVDRFKISSFEAGDEEFVAAHGQYGKQVILSTGMLDGEDWVDLWPPEINDLVFLHCVSAYPCPLEEASIGNANIGGYSDHTRNVLTGALAVAAGAEFLEVHFRLDDTSPSPKCPDYFVALSPNELKEYIRLARLAHTMRGDDLKRPQPSEILNMKHRVQP